ncbi:class I SAM-dependent methyltransferase [Nocardia sp. NPDC020380]|uniref:class I SAM-dependent methyltransferase n=1 Tax=Nocardia sp. NPDC020380 TaxID=3364309 RepID=UPI003794ABFE
MTEHLERATSFGSIAADYDRFRPGPAAAAVDWLVPDGCAIAVDLAAGTGLLTRAVAERVPEVIAVEPDGRMRAVLQARSPGVRVQEGTAEAIPLPDASVDALFVSAAWHWFDHERATWEIGRVLRDGGRLGVVRTSRDRAVDWVRELERARDLEPLPSDAQLRRHRDEFKLPDNDLFEPGERESFAFTRVMTLDDAVAWLATYSGMIIADPDDRRTRLARARTVLEEHAGGAGTIEIPLRTEGWRARRLLRVGM